MKRTLTSHRRNFPHAVTLAAMGYHFRLLTQSYLEENQLGTARSS
jgi:hypothetical protein